MDDFREYLISISLADDTIRNYLNKLVRAQEWAAKHGVDLAHPLPSDLRELSRIVPNTNSSRRHLRQTLIHYWKMLDVDGPIDAIRVPPAPDPVYRGLPDDHVWEMIKVSRREGREGIMVALGAYAGKRRTEIARGDWRDIDDKTGTLRIFGKGSRTRFIPLDPRLRRALDPYREATGPMLPGRFGGPINPNTVNDWIAHFAEKAGIGHVTPHQLRHSFAQKLYEGTNDIHLVAEMMGHRDLKSTRIYTMVTMERKAEALKFLDWGETPRRIGVAA